MSGSGLYFGRGGRADGGERGGGGGGGADRSGSAAGARSAGGAVDAASGACTGSGVTRRGAPPSRAARSVRSEAICSYSARTCCSNTAIRCSSAIAPPWVKLLERLRRRAVARRNCESDQRTMVTVDVAVCLTGMIVPAAFTVSDIVWVDVEPR